MTMKRESDETKLPLDTAGIETSAEDVVSRAREEAAMRDDDDNFEWRATHNNNVVCPEQRAIAIYTNPYGQAVIRQERSWTEEEDPYVCISKFHLQDVIDRLQAILSED